MATYDYTKLKNTANRLLTKYGNTGTLTRSTDTGDWTKKVNPVTQRPYWEDSEANIVYVDPGPVTYNCVCVIDTWPSSYYNNNLVQSGDAKLIVYSTEFTEIYSSDKLTFNDVEYQITEPINKIAPDGNVIVFEVNARG